MIAFLLHHANRTTKMPEFYAVKDRLLKNAEVVGYNIQHIEGKTCHSCGGSGIYHSEFSDFTDMCDRCYNGWYKRPMWVFLARKKFGKYYFHKPMDRKYGVTNPYLPSFNIAESVFIDGYIDHQYTRYGFLAVLILFLIYDRQAFKKYFHEMGMGWRSYWYYPMNYLHVVAHFVRHGKDAYPLKMLRAKYNSYFAPVRGEVDERKIFIDHLQDSDLPF